MKKALFYLLLASLFATNVMSAHAVETSSEEISIPGYTNNGETLELSETEVQKYKKYELRQDIIQNKTIDGTMLDTVTAHDIESLCKVTDSYVLTGAGSDLEVVEYSSDSLQNYLDYCKEITSISKTNYMNIEYLSTDGMEIILSYSDDGIVKTCVYNPKTDIFVYIGADKSEKYTHFREGEQYEMPADVSRQIDEYIDAEDWDAIEAIPGITVVDFGDGTHAVDLEIDTGVVVTDNEPHFDIPSLLRNLFHFISGV